MTSQPIEDSALLTFRFKQTADDEEFQWGIKIVKRLEADWAALLAAVHTWGTGHLAHFTHGCTLTGITYSEWETAGFTGFHQAASLVTADAMGSGNPLPPQCAVVLSLLNDDEPSTPLRRRRGRVYLGLVSQTMIDTNGRLATIQQSGIQTDFVALQTALETVASTTGDFNGISIVSQADGVIRPANKIGVGLGIDTQRRRRRHVVESITYTSVWP